jgi:hypothetical protein
MKRKITGAILISLSLGFLWQALAVDVHCETRCKEIYSNCLKIAGRAYCPSCIERCREHFHTCLGNCVH